MFNQPSRAPRGPNDTALLSPVAAPSVPADPQPPPMTPPKPEQPQPRPQPVPEPPAPPPVRQPPPAPPPIGDPPIAPPRVALSALADGSQQSAVGLAAP